MNEEINKSTETIKEDMSNILRIGRITNIGGKDGELQDIQLKTLRNIEDAFKVGQFGINAKSPIGSRCIVAKIGNEKIVIANENQASIIDVSSGNTVLYNANGDYVKLENGTITVKADSIDFVSETLTHNGTNIGDTHTHPQSNDSGGDSQEDTEHPQ